MSTLSPQYDPAQHEPTVYSRWEEAGVFAPNEAALAAGKQPFVIMMPLPNVTGVLHMGHALNGTMQDILIRYHRMLGEPVLWQPGIDHAGIATQNVVEKELRKEGTTRHDLGREKFIERVWQWKEQYGATIVSQQQRLGLSADWSRSRFTMDPDYVRAVQETFIRYYQRGYIYRGNRIVNWCPRCASVISDLEIKHEARTDTLYHLKYPLADGTDSITVATTRPETMLADTAVAVHPADERYTGFRGKEIKLPITGRLVPIIFDERVDQKFGTGAVKVTPAHDPLDADIAETHHLPVLNIITERGTLNDAAGDYAGLSVSEARQSVIERLRTDQVLVAEADLRHNVALCDRCGTVIEPLVSRQWFVDMSQLKDATIAVAQEGQVQFHPARWREHFVTWLENVHDWTISRQLWWGHSIPVWWQPGVRGTAKENEPGTFVVATAKPAGDWEADPDVLDTWFSSALWPFATLGWPEATRDLNYFYPGSVLVTARDIVYLWVARMIFSGLELMQDPAYGKQSIEQRIPFRQVVVHPTVLNKDGQRMSKSLGTGVDPVELINQYGADATRFGLMYQMTYDSQALKFDEQSIVAARNFGNKLWNLGRFILSLADQDTPTSADDWILARSRMVTTQVSKLLNEYHLGEAARVIHEFVWDDFADWYIEILKVQGSTKTAREVFQTILALLHPFMPHLTEVLWQECGNDELLAVSPWPEPASTSINMAAVAHIERLQDIVRTIRSARVLLGIAPGAQLAVAVDNPPVPEIIAPLAKVTLSARTADMKTFPLHSGGSVAIGGEHVTTEALARATEKLQAELSQAQELLNHLTATLEKMATKAPAERIAAMEVEREKAEYKVLELAKSLALLK